MKIKNVFRAIALTWHFDKKYIIIKILLEVLTTFVAFTTMNVSKQIVDVVASSGTLWKGMILLLILALLGIFSLLIKWFRNQYVPKVQLCLNMYIQKSLIKRITKIDYCHFDDPKFYDDMERALHESTGLTKSLDVFISISFSFVNFLLAMILCLQYNFIIPLILIVGVVPYCFFKQRLNKYTYDVSKEVSSIGRKSSAVRHLLTSKYYAHEVRSYDLSDFLLKKHEELANKRINLTVMSNQKKNMYSFGLSLINLIINTLSTAILIYSALKRRLTIGNFTLLQSYVAKIQSSLNSLTDGFLKISEANLYLDNLFVFIDEADNAVTKKGKLELESSVPHKIEFKNVSFKYPNSDRVILDNISFTIQPGEAVMLIGENGSGKSTLLMLLHAFYDSYTGDILIDDINLRDINPESVWKSTSMMFQGGNLLPISLKENLVFDGEVCVNDFNEYPWFSSLVRKYPDGLDTILLTYMYPNGVQPSGGETQQIKFMRTILKKNAGCIIMDEPSNALDPEKEYLILSSIKSIAKSRTSIIVSHKLSCALFVDKIIHLKDGKVIEIGSHESLMKNDGEYARLFKLQSENYISNNTGDI